MKKDIRPSPAEGTGLIIGTEGSGIAIHEGIGVAIGKDGIGGA